MENYICHIGANSSMNMTIYSHSNSYKNLVDIHILLLLGIDKVKL